MSIEVRPIRTRKEQRDFITLPWRVYRDDPLWVPPLKPDRKQAIDRDANAFFKRGQAEFFVAYQDGKPAGTICAAHDPQVTNHRNSKEMIFGFFDFVPDSQVFKALLGRAEQWGRDHHLNRFYGPFNLDYEDSYGLLVEGRDRPPVLMCAHTPTYYQDYLEGDGFYPARPVNIALEIPLYTERLDRMIEVAGWLKRKKWITVRDADFDNWEDEVAKVLYLLNHSLGHLEGQVNWHIDDLTSMLAPFKQIADPDLILFADVRGKTVGFLPAVPNLNEHLIHVNGLRYPWNYLQLLWRMRKPTDCAAVKSILVLPEYWNTGVAVALAGELMVRMRARGYEWVDLSITSEDNPNSVLMAEKLGARIYKRWQVYAKEFDAIN